MRVFENACPSGASIGLEVYTRYKHHFLFLAQTTITYVHMVPTAYSSIAITLKKSLGFTS